MKDSSSSNLKKLNIKKYIIFGKIILYPQFPPLEALIFLCGTLEPIAKAQ